MKLRPYQEQSVDAIFAAWKEFKRTLLVLPTGTGKTVVFSNVAAQCAQRERVLILAHRDELIRQAADKLNRACGLDCAIEKAEETALGSYFNITCGSVQTLMRQSRLERFARDYYGTIIIDEAHHALSSSYQNILDYWNGAKVLGVTATPDRGDKKNLGAVFESIAFEYSMRAAIQDGYLSKIVCETIPLKIDLGNVHVKAGDYDAGELGTALEPYLESIAAKIPQDRKTLIFLPLIATSERMTELLKARGLRAEHIDGKSEDRREILKRFERGDIDVLCNSMLLTEGFDEPSIDCVVCLRPTKSRALYTQIIGRGTRPLAGKENLLVLDFLWHSAKHDLCHAAHLIAPKAETAVKMREISEQKGCGAQMELLELEESANNEIRTQRESALADRFKNLSTKNGRLLDPLQYALSVHDDDLQDYEPEMPWELAPASAAQIALLEKNGFDASTIPNKGYACKILDRMTQRREAGLCTPKQMKILQPYGYKDVGNWSFDAASAAIGAIAANGWRRPYYKTVSF